MHHRSPTVTLTVGEAAKLRSLIREIGTERARIAVGNIDRETLYKAASECPVARLTAFVIRTSLDRI
jgi:hypothetical protein